MTAGAAVRAGAGVTARAGVGPMTGGTVGFAAGLAGWFGRVGVEVGGSGGVAVGPGFPDAAFAAAVARRTGVAVGPAARFAAGAGLACRAATAGAAGAGLGDAATKTIGEPLMTASIVRSGVGWGMFVGVASALGPAARAHAVAPSSVAPKMTSPSERRALDRRAPANRMLPPPSRRLADDVHDARIHGARRRISIGNGAEKLQPNRARSTPRGALLAPGPKM
jgi:hypothetical protein